LTLNDLHTGEKAIIIRIRGIGAFRKRITEMGFVEGQSVRVIKAAPLKDPVEYRVMSGNVSLRRAEASLIEVRPKEECEHREEGKKFRSFVIDSPNNGSSSAETKVINVALVGNPNCGKTTLFNRVSRSHEHVGNYSGVTISSKQASIEYKGYDVRFTDLPGTYSLSAYSEEEVIVRDHINKEKPDIVVNVVDASHLERHLYLTTQLIDMGIQVVLALNMYDDLEEKGDKLDIDMLGKLIGIPIVPTIGRRGKGIFRLLNRIIKVIEDREPVIRHTHINYGTELEQSISKIEKKLENYPFLAGSYHIRQLAIKAVEKDDYSLHILSELEEFAEIQALVNDEIYRLENLYNNDSETLISNARYAFISGALKETYKKSKSNPGATRTQRIDRILTNKYLSFPIFLLFLYIMFQTTFSLGNYPMEWIALGINFLSDTLINVLPAGIFTDLLVDGVIGGVGGVIVFLPNILILFLFISIMEDTGYMARTAFIMDKVMHLFGLHGKSFIPLIMGFGCNVPAIMATRTLENKKDRILTMLIIPFMSCSARLPVYILVAGAVFPNNAGNVIFLLYLIGIVVSLLMAILFKNTLFKKVDAPFVMELPLYRSPGLKVVLKHMWIKGEMYLKKMGGIILIASVIIWALGYFPRNVEYSKDYDKLIQAELVLIEQENVVDKSVDSDIIETSSAEKQLSQLYCAKEGERQAYSYIGRIGHGIEPLIRPLGFDWKMGISLVTGFAAKEVVVSTMGVLYQDNSHGEATVSLQEKIRTYEYTEGDKAGQLVYTPLAAFSFLLFVLLYLPCVAVIATIGRESGSWKWSAFVLFYTTALAWTASFCVYQIGSLF